MPILRSTSPFHAGDAWRAKRRRVYALITDAIIKAPLPTLPAAKASDSLNERTESCDFTRNTRQPDAAPVDAGMDCTRVPLPITSALTGAGAQSSRSDDGSRVRRREYKFSLPNVRKVTESCIGLARSRPYRGDRSERSLRSVTGMVLEDDANFVVALLHTALHSPLSRRNSA